MKQPTRTRDRIHDKDHDDEDNLLLTEEDEHRGPVSRIYDYKDHRG